MPRYQPYEVLLDSLKGAGNEVTVLVADAPPVVGEVEKLDDGGVYINHYENDGVGVAESNYVAFRDIRGVKKYERDLRDAW